MIFKKLIDDEFHLIEIERLGDIIKSSLLHGFHGILDRTICRDHDNANAGMLLFHCSQNFHSAHIGKTKVRNHKIIRFLIDDLHRLFPVHGSINMISLILKCFLEEISDHFFVIEYEYPLPVFGHC